MRDRKSDGFGARPEQATYVADQSAGQPCETAKRKIQWGRSAGWIRHGSAGQDCVPPYYAPASGLLERKEVTKTITANRIAPILTADDGDDLLSSSAYAQTVCQRARMHCL